MNTCNSHRAKARPSIEHTTVIARALHASTMPGVREAPCGRLRRDPREREHTLKPVLVRSTPAPHDVVTPWEAWELNAFHNNTGNVAFPFGIFRNLTLESRTVQSDWYGARLPSPEEVNEKYSMYILPMANDFGGHFAAEMRRMTRFIKKLTIPVVVVGIGGAFSIEEKFEQPFSFDNTVKEFLKAVLERSSSVGLRGAITGRYLRSLGFKEGSDFHVIGDPTLYDLGRDLNIRDLADPTEGPIAYNMTPKAPAPALAFLTKLADEHSDATYVPQDMGEFSKYYYGMVDPTANTIREVVDNFPKLLTDKAYASGRIRFFFDFISWVEYMKNIRFSIGTRIHGNVIPTYAGVPSLTLAYGSRLKELAEIHGLPHLEAKKVDPEIDVRDLCEQFDFHTPERIHGENYDRFVNFLDENDIQHLYRKSPGENVPYDALIANKEEHSLTPITQLTDGPEVIRRLEKGMEIVQKKVISQKARLDRMTGEVKDARSKLSKIENIIKS